VCKVNKLKLIVELISWSVVNEIPMITQLVKNLETRVLVSEFLGYEIQRFGNWTYFRLQ
jgi:hypothetical protein